MPSLKDIKRRRDSIQNLKKITDTMHMVSSIRFKKIQDKIQYSTEMIEKLMDIMGKIPIGIAPSEGTPLIIVISSDRGMAGAFNINLLNMAYEKIRDMKAPKIIALGQKAKNFFKRRELTLFFEYSKMEEKLPSEILTKITKIAIQEYEKRCQVFVAYTHFISSSHHEPRMITMLPPPFSKRKTRGEYLYEPAPEEISKKLMEFYVKMSLQSFYAHSYTSEQAARMLAMEKATENADELLEELEHEFHKSRKNIITSEIAEIVSGAQHVLQ